MTMPRAWLLGCLGVAAVARLATLLLPSADGDDPADLVAPRPAAAASRPVGEREPALAMAQQAQWTPGQVQRMVVGADSDPLFAPRGWLPPPPAPPVAPPAPPPPPVADAPAPPRVGFVVLGRVDAEADVPRVVISQGDSVQVVGVGDVIDSTFRVDALAASTLTLTHLPTQRTVNLPLSGVPR